MPISEIVDAWCKERNIESGANSWVLALCLAVLVFAGLYGVTSALGWMVAAAVSALLWLVLAPKPISYRWLRTRSISGWDVDDALLARLAEAQTVPEWAKTAIANELERNHRITFETLFGIEVWIQTAADEARIERQKGFQKMVAFSQRNISR